MKTYFIIGAKNIIRTLFYHVFAFYERRFKNKIPVYDLQTIALIRRLPVDAVCVDIGVNEAQLFHHMAKRCSKGQLYGFEPIPHLYQYLSGKYSSNRIKLFQQVLSDGESDISFFYFPLRTDVSGISRRSGLLGDLEPQELKYTTKSFDQFISLSRIDLIKIDVEGAELKVLRGAREHIRICKPVVVFECGLGGLDYFKDTPEDVFDFFAEIGYGVSLVRYYLDKLPPMDRATFLYVFKQGYEYQYLAHPL